jgi:hypothetical protein
MSLTLEQLLIRLGDDRALLESLHDEGLLPPPLERTYSEEEVEQARVARVLMRELEVNFAGVEVILHMRREMLTLRHQILDLLHELHSRP